MVEAARRHPGGRVHRQERIGRDVPSIGSGRVRRPGLICLYSKLSGTRLLLVGILHSQDIPDLPGHPFQVPSPPPPLGALVGPEHLIGEAEVPHHWRAVAGDLVEGKKSV